MFRHTAKYSTGLGVALLIGAQSAFAAGHLAVRTRSAGDRWIIYAAIFGAALAIIAISSYLDKVRSEKIAAFARSLGLTYRRKAIESDAGLAIGCHLAGLGHSNKISNILEAAKTPELGFVLFDYQYTIGYGRGSQTVRQTISRMQSSLLHLPSFILFPETILFRLGDKITGRKDIDFSDSPVFSQAFVLRGEDDPAVRALFSPKLRQALEATPKLTIEGNGDHLFIFRGAHRLKPEEFSATIEQDKKILALFFEAQQGSAAAG
jgi:hypothetical protein